jgi:hypothetical protein
MGRSWTGLEWCCVPVLQGAELRMPLPSANRSASAQIGYDTVAFKR